MNYRCLHLETFSNKNAWLDGCSQSRLLAEGAWSYFIRKVYETDPLICPNCQGEILRLSHYPHIASVTPIAKTPAHFGFSILDFRLSEREKPNRIRGFWCICFLANRKSAI